MNRIVWAPLLLAACTTGATPPPSAPVATDGTPGNAPRPASTHALALPGATGAVTLDYLGIDRARGKAWVPAGNTGNVDIVDVGSEAIATISGFATAEREARGNKRVLGPSSVTIGNGTAYIGDRASAEICEIDTVSQAKGVCAKLPASPDGIQYIEDTQEVWATTPHENAIVVLAAGSKGALAVKGSIPVEGGVEGYATDPAHHLFYTNLEDADKTVAIDTVTKKVTATWKAECGGDGPRGLAIDLARNYLIVACTDGVHVVDPAKGGAILAKATTGAGVDNIDYVESRKELFVASGRDGMLTIFQVGDGGALTVKQTFATAKGARVVVAHADGTAIVADPANGKVIVIHR